MDLFGETPKEKEEPVIEEEISLAEPPEPEGPLKARQTALCIGHDDVEKQLLGLYAAGRMPHAMIFAGPSGIGKSIMAFRLARFLLKNKPADRNQNSMFSDLPSAAPTSFDMSPDDPIFRRVASGGHPDILTVEREYDETKGRQKLSVSVDEVRRIAPFLRHTASEAGWRVVIIDDADMMTHSSQNGILKILEEPPANTVLVLVTHRAGALIPTIRSRSRVISFRPLAADTIETLLQKNGFAFAPDELETLIHISGGSFGRALNFISEGGLELLGQVLGILETYPSYDWERIHALSDDLGRMGRDQAFAGFAGLLPWLAGQLVLAKARGEGEARHPLQTKALTALVQNSSLAQLSEICENLQGHFETVQRANLDKRQGVLQAFSMMRKAA